MLDQVTLFGSRGDALRPSRNGHGADGWLAVSPHAIGSVAAREADGAVRSHGGLFVAASGDAVEIHATSAQGYRPPDKALLAGEAEPRWIELPGSVALSPADCLVVPEDRDAQDDLESLRSLLMQLPEDRQGLMWLALGRPDAQYQLMHLEQELRELQQAPPPVAPSAEPPAAPTPSGKPWGLIAGAAVLGAVLGVGGALFWPQRSPRAAREVKVEPPPPRIPLLTVSDMDQLDLAVERSPKKEVLLAAIGDDAKLHAMNDEGFIALAKLVLLKAGVKDVAGMESAQVIEKISGMESEIGAYPKLLAQYLCDSPMSAIEPPETFPPCTDAAGADELRRTYFNLLAFLDAEPAP
jgi:hypothetical protein